MSGGLRSPIGWYIRQIIDTVHDLPNVLYEVANESSGDTGDSVKLPDGTTMATPIGDSTEWQYRVIDFVKQYEHQRGYDKHPIGMTMQYPVRDQRKVNAPLFNSHADWISPGFDEIAATAKKGDGPPPGRWLLDPPPNDGTKVIISDTDHYSPFHSDPLWAWKSLLRGHNPVLYDFGIVMGVNAPNPPPGSPPYQAYEPTRHAMGNALRYAGKVKLLEKLTAGTYAVAWYDVDTRDEVERERLAVVSPATVTFDAPFAPAVLYLKRAVP